MGVQFICPCECPIYMSENGTWSFLVSGSEIRDFLKLSSNFHQVDWKIPIGETFLIVQRERNVCQQK
jgi:hypothetical protein